MWYVTLYTWHIKKLFKKNHLPFLSVSVLFDIGATIQTHQDVQCLPYARFVPLLFTGHWQSDLINYCSLQGIQGDCECFVSNWDMSLKYKQIDKKTLI